MANIRRNCAGCCCTSFWCLILIIVGIVMLIVGFTLVSQNEGVKIAGGVLLGVGVVGFVVGCAIWNRKCSGCEECVSIICCAGH